MILNKKEEIEKLKQDIIGLQQINEQLELEISKKEKFILDYYPAVTNMKIDKGSSNVWGDCYSFKVEIDVEGEDLHRLVKYLTHRKLTKDKYQQIVEGK